ncbi:MAG TPA: DUF3313 family protein [Casimicrobiaceae bacterium]|nr:DUF3313 family protein [Casimicrobiaceae bacterium]
MSFRTLAVVCTVLLGIAFAATSQAQATAPSAPDGLAAWLSKNFDEVYVRPNTDFAGYRKVIIDQPQVAFQKGWLKSLNRTRDVSRWLSQDDERRITDDMAAGMGRVFTDVFRTQGYEVAAAPGPGVLRLTVNVNDVFLNAPDVPAAGPTRLFSTDTADATLVLEARDAVSGALVARFVDRRTAREIKPVYNYTTSVSNQFWMDALARQWATNSVKELQAGVTSRG